MKRKFIHL